MEGRQSRTPLAAYFLVVILAFSVLTLFMSSRYTVPIGESTLSIIQAHLETSKSKHEASESQQNQPEDPVEIEAEDLSEDKQSQAEEPAKQNQPEDQADYNLAGLDCQRFDGPSADIAKEMVYWEDIPADNHHESPLKKPGVTQYLTFEPDQGGWNNIRMAMETVLALAFAMGRTLVLPPEQRMYLLEQGKHKKHGKEQRNKFSFNHFFHMEAIHSEHPGLNIITMEQFLKEEALTGHFRNPKTGQVTFPPGNRTDWNGLNRNQLMPLYQWLRESALTAIWEPNDCLAVFPASADPKHVQTLESYKPELLKLPGNSHEAYIGKPTPVNASALDRVKENWASRKDLCIYNETMQSAPFVHFPDDFQMDARLLVHFYAFLFFEDWQQDLWMKRFIRDHVRYVDEIQCAAARVVHAVRQRAKERDLANVKGDFDSFHIRRGDFQYKETRVEAEVLYNQSQRVFQEGATVFIATDERNKTFFQPLMDHYDVVFLDDFLDSLHNVNSNYFGMIDQLVASRGRKFIGCWFSTFTGYINRLRGYHANREKAPGYEQGIVQSWYYARPGDFDHMQSFKAVKQSFFAREFPTSWRLIDTGIEDFHKRMAVQ